MCAANRHMWDRMCIYNGPYPFPDCKTLEL